MINGALYNLLPVVASIALYFRRVGCGPLSVNMVMRARIVLIISKVTYKGGRW